MSDQSSPQELKRFLPRFWRLLEPFHRQMWWAFGWIVAVQICAFVEPTAVMYVVNGIGNKSPTVSDHLWLVMGIMLATLWGIGILQIRKNKRIRDIIFGIERDLPQRCGQKLLALPLSYHQRENTGAIIGKVVRGVGRCTDVMGVMLWEIVPLIVQSVLTGIILLMFSIPAAVVLVPVVALFAFLTGNLKMRLSGQRAARHEKEGEADELLGQSVTNVMTVQAFAQERSELDAAKGVRDKVYAMGMTEFEEFDKWDYLRNGLISLGRVGVITVCVYTALNDAIELGTLFYVIQLSERVFVTCYRIGAIFDRLMEAAEPVMRMTRILEEPEWAFNGRPLLPVPERFRGDIAFERLTFSYGGATEAAKKPALTEVSLPIKAGETVGIVGESGGGKSTLVKLLMAFVRASDGRVTIDGIDICDMDPTVYRRQLGFVPQEVEVFDMSVADNIAFGRREATREDIEAAARVANAHDFIMSLPNGYDELVGNRGLRLSGGQRQRIGIARAVLLNPPILVFDEATSHVDVVSEQKIHAAMDVLSKGRTVIIIAHRLSTVRSADRIVVMEQGRIKETGSHAELMEQQGIYHRLVALQNRVDSIA